MSLYDKLIDYINSSSKVENYELTEKKISNRAFNFKEEDGCIYFEMERHEAALGSTYTPGLAMSAYKTRTEGYTYCPDSGILTQTLVSEPKLEVDSIDVLHLAEDAFFDIFFSITQIDEENYLLEEITNGFNIHIKSLEEAVLYSKKYVNDLNLKYFFEYECKEFIIEEVKEQLYKSILEEVYKIAADRVEEAWNNMEELEE